ncbi:hypothetical protein A2U01_0072597, partial [Trifolium medium]|nr:hypothetical protein [Trifolium medium]
MSVKIFVDLVPDLERVTTSNGIRRIFHRNLRIHNELVQLVSKNHTFNLLIPKK